MWKYHDFSVTRILREIKFGGFRSSKINIFAILGALFVVNLVDLSAQKIKNSESLNVLKWQIEHF